MPELSSRNPILCINPIIMPNINLMLRNQGLSFKLLLQINLSAIGFAVTGRGVIIKKTMPNKKQ
jgi:hypothetical protein